MLAYYSLILALISLTIANNNIDYRCLDINDIHSTFDDISHTSTQLCPGDSIFLRDKDTKNFRQFKFKYKARPYLYFSSTDPLSGDWMHTIRMDYDGFLTKIKDHEVAVLWEKGASTADVIQPQEEPTLYKRFTDDSLNAIDYAVRIYATCTDALSCTSLKLDSINMYPITLHTKDNGLATDVGAPKQVLSENLNTMSDNHYIEVKNGDILRIAMDMDQDWTVLTFKKYNKARSVRSPIVFTADRGRFGEIITMTLKEMRSYIVDKKVLYSEKDNEDDTMKWYVLGATKIYMYGKKIKDRKEKTVRFSENPPEIRTFEIGKKKTWFEKLFKAKVDDDDWMDQDQDQDQNQDIYWSDLYQYFVDLLV